jgi:hypothetical protein
MLNDVRTDTVLMGAVMLALWQWSDYAQTRHKLSLAFGWAAAALAMLAKGPIGLMVPVLGLGVHRPRCLEEYLAWRFALDRLAEFGVETEGPVARRFDRSMRYAVAKAMRRGIRRLPAELATFLP